MARRLDNRVVLYERHVECAAVDAVYDRLAAGRGAVLVLRGEAGVGKSAVLDYARAQRGACRVLSMVGVETEQPMAYSGVHELLHEDFHLIDALPPAQGAALRAALGFDQGAADRFLVCLAVLAVLSDAASSGLVCLVDDLQWLDSASIDVLNFAGRRLASEPVAFVVAVRSDMTSLPFPDGVVVDVGGLGVAAAAAMLAAVHGSTVAEAVAGELVARTGGNPLALGELARALPSAVLSGAAPLPDPMPVGASVQAAFARQVSGYPDATRLMLLIAAAEHADLGTVLGVAAELGADAAALEVAETDGVVRVTESGIEFRHPLIRSTVYGTAGFLRRQGVHRGYAAVLTDDRRAWHLAAAASGTDESVAQLLDAAAYRAAAHGALTSAAATWERAAALSAEDARRGARLVQAASASWSAGHAERVPMLLTQAQHCPLDRFGSARATLVRGRYETRKGVMTEGAKLLLDAAGDAVTDDPRLAIDIALEAMMASLYGGDPAGFVAAGRLADGLPAGTGELEFYRRICAGIGRIFAGDQDGAAGLLSSAGAPPGHREGLAVRRARRGLQRHRRLGPVL